MHFKLKKKKNVLLKTCFSYILTKSKMSRHNSKINLKKVSSVLKNASSLAYNIQTALDLSFWRCLLMSHAYAGLRGDDIESVPFFNKSSTNWYTMWSSSLARASERRRDRYAHFNKQQQTASVKIRMGPLLASVFGAWQMKPSGLLIVLQYQ